MYALDGERRIIFVNTAVENWSGATAAELVGQRCDFHSPEPVASVNIALAALCPPPEVWQGTRLTGRILCPRSNATSERSVEFLPLLGDDGTCVGIVAIMVAHDLPQPNLNETASASTDHDPTTLHERLWRFRRQWRDRFQLGRLVGDSPRMRQVRSQVALAATGRANVLIVGPSGSGRKHVARTIHALADPAVEQPLSIIAGAQLNAEQFDAQWNSTIQRANSRRAEVASGTSSTVGTVLLTDVDLLSADAQRQLVRQLNAPSSSLRVLATATSLPYLSLALRVRDLKPTPEFLPDLASSLATLTINLLPLTQRIGDLPLLAQAFLEEQNAIGKKQLSRLTAEAIEALAGYPWPGNVAELSKFIGEAHAKAEGPFLGAADLPKRIRLANDANVRPKKSPTPIQLETFLAEVETELIRRALTQSKQNKSKAAELLGLSRQRLLRRMAQLEID